MPRRIVPLDVTFYERDFTASEVTITNAIYLVDSYSKHVYGGCLDALIIGYGTLAAVRSMEALKRCPVLIEGNGSEAWWGEVHEVQVMEGGATDGVTLDTMYNHVQVAHTTPGTAANPSGERLTTAVASDATSIAEYGQRELLTTLDKATVAEAERERDRLLTQHKDPVPVPVDFSAPAYPYRAVIRCRGWEDTLDWRRYALDEGLIGYESTDESESLWALAVGQASYGPATTISFADTKAADIIEDSAGSLPFVTRQIVWTSGASLADNNSATASQGGAWPVVSAATGQITVYDPSYDFDSETEGASVTIAPYGTKVAQSFQHAYSASVYLSKIRVMVRKAGAPADNFVIALHADDTNKPAATALASVSIAAADIGESFAWADAVFDSTVELVSGTKYWVVIDRSGVASTDNFYLVQANDQAGYASGACFVFHNSAWAAFTLTHAAAADLLFVVEGTRQTTDQISALITSHGQFFTGTTITDASGVYTVPHQSGDFTAKTRLEELLARGTTNGRRLLAEVTSGRTLNVYEEPAQNPATDYALDTNNALYDETDTEILPFLCPVGFWVGRRDGATASVAFIERSEYVATTGELHLEPRGVSSPYEQTVFTY